MPPISELRLHPSTEKPGVLAGYDWKAVMAIVIIDKEEAFRVREWFQRGRGTRCPEDDKSTTVATSDAE
jgi:hypothetical protein